MFDTVIEQRASTNINQQVDALRTQLADLAAQQQKIDSELLDDADLDEGYRESLMAQSLEMPERIEALAKTLAAKESDYRIAALGEQVEEIKQQVDSWQVQRGALAYEQAEVEMTLESTSGHENESFVSQTIRRREILGQIAALEIVLARRETDYRDAQVALLTETIHRAYQELDIEVRPRQVALNRRIGKVGEDLQFKRGQFQNYLGDIRMRLDFVNIVFDKPMPAEQIQKRLDETDNVWAKYDQVTAELQVAQAAFVEFERERYQTARRGALLVGRIQEAVSELKKLEAPLPDIVDVREYRCFLYR